MPPLISLLLIAMQAAAPVQPGVCQELFEQGASRAVEAEAISTNQGSSAFRELREKRSALALEAAETRAALLELACKPGSPSVSLDVFGQELDRLHRRWLQLECHRLGKDLAIAELRRDGGDPSPALDDRIEIFRQLVDSCIANGEAAGEVQFAAADGGVVHAELHGAGRRAVVLAHGGRFTKESWRGQIPAFLDAGLRVLALDFRGRGRSRGPGGTRDGAESDVLGAVRYLRATGSTWVGVVGASFGGGAAAEASVLAEEGEIDALVLLAHSSIDEPNSMKGRKLFLVARDDVRGGGISRLDEVRAQYEAAPQPKELVVIEGAAHAQFLFDTEHGNDVLRHIVDFLRKP